MKTDDKTKCDCTVCCAVDRAEAIAKEMMATSAIQTTEVEMARVKLAQAWVTFAYSFHSAKGHTQGCQNIARAILGDVMPDGKVKAN